MTTLVLAALIAAAVGWCAGHRTARIRIIVIGATPADDEAAFLAEERHRFDQLVAGLDLDVPDDPGNSA